MMRKLDAPPELKALANALLVRDVARFLGKDDETVTRLTNSVYIDTYRAERAKQEPLVE